MQNDSLIKREGVVKARGEWDAPVEVVEETPKPKAKKAPAKKKSTSKKK